MSDAVSVGQFAVSDNGIELPFLRAGERQPRKVETEC